MNPARVFQNGEEGRATLVGDFTFASIPSVGDGVVLEKDGERLNLGVTNITHLAVKAETEEPYTYVYCDLV